jgi:coenzyme F420-reducing hydrogenase delta subunit/ferredoxin
MPTNFNVIRVMCSARVKVEFILKGLSNGLDGIMVLGCHIGDCHYISGNHRTLKRFTVLKRLLAHVGINPDRLYLDWVSASEGEKFQAVVTEFVNTIRKLGSNELRTIKLDMESQHVITDKIKVAGGKADEADSTQIAKLKSTVEELLASGEVAGVLGLRKSYGNVVPYIFRADNLGDLGSIVISPKYPMMNFGIALQLAYPDKKFGIIGRGCDERAMIELGKRNQLNLDDIRFIGVACTRADAEECNCEHPYPQHIDVGTKADGVTVNKNVDKLYAMPLKTRLQFWINQFSRCIKCYGCKSVCPVCVCDDCMLEDKLWVKGGELPPEIPTFHLIRAYHVADKCTGCLECSSACPMDIPLPTLYTMLRADMKELFDYVPGIDVTENPPLITTLDETPLKDL